MIRNLLIFTILFCLPLLAQERDITPALKLIERGEIEAANSILQSYKTDFPNDPSVIFLDGVLTKDGTTAVKKYATVTQRFPNSKYADAALYRIFSYYYSIGYYERARSYMEKLKYDYPNSPYIKMGDRDIPDSESLALAQASENSDATDSMKKEEGSTTSSASTPSLIPPKSSSTTPVSKPTSSVELLKKSSAALEKFSSAKVEEKTSSKTNTKPAVKTNEKPAVNVPPITQEAKKDTLIKLSDQPNLNDAVNANFTIQAGAFLNQDNAKKLSDRFKKDGYYSKLGTKNVGGADFSIVFIGRFRTEEDGKIILDYLKDNHRIYGRIIPIEE